MPLAEELDVRWGQVRLERAPLDKIQNNITTIVDSRPFHPGDESTLKRGVGWITAKLPCEAEGLMITDGSASRRAASAAQTSSADIRQRLANALDSDEGDVIHQAGATFAALAGAARGGVAPAVGHAGRGKVKQTR